MTEEERDRLIADSMETSPEMLPFLAELLAEVWALGGNPDIVLRLLLPLGLPRDSRLLDLGCGKGGVSLPIAANLGFRVLGVDLFEPFVSEALARARQMGLADRCQFELLDMAAVLETARDYDVVLHSALGVLEDTIESLRRVVRPGGFIVIDDCYSPDGTVLARPGYEHVRSREETRTRLTRHGDRIIEEIAVPSADMRALNQTVNAAIQSRATGIYLRHPDAAELIREYVVRQEEECRVLETEVVNAVWLIQRT